MIFAELISYPQAILLGLLQGASELFPISSLGHSVILPQLRTLNHGLSRQQQRALEQVEHALEEIVSPFVDKVSRDVATCSE